MQLNEKQRASAGTFAIALISVALFFIPWRIESSGELRWAPFYRNPVVGQSILSPEGSITNRFVRLRGQPVWGLWLLQLAAIGACGAAAHWYLRERLFHRPATLADVPELRDVMDAAIAELQKPFLSQEQITSSRAIMGIDTQLIRDGTYFVVEIGGRIAGCGGWSRRETLYGSDQTPDRNPAPLDPATDPARTRAMYTHPDFTRQGVGRLVLSLCEEAALSEGFRTMELMATMAGVPLYEAADYLPVEEVTDERGGAPVPLVRMRKALA